MPEPGGTPPASRTKGNCAAGEHDRFRQMICQQATEMGVNVSGNQVSIRREEKTRPCNIRATLIARWLGWQAMPTLEPRPATRIAGIQMPRPVPRPKRMLPTGCRPPSPAKHHKLALAAPGAHHQRAYRPGDMPAVPPPPGSGCRCRCSSTIGTWTIGKAEAKIGDEQHDDISQQTGRWKM